MAIAELFKVTCNKPEEQPVKAEKTNREIYEEILNNSTAGIPAKKQKANLLKMCLILTQENGWTPGKIARFFNADGLKNFFGQKWKAPNIKSLLNEAKRCM